MFAMLAAGLSAVAVISAVTPTSVARVDTGERVVALTFDACATNGQANGFDRALFETLKREGVPVTVFLGGRWIEFHPEAARQLAAEPWIEIGNHTWDHPHLPRLSDQRVGEEIDRTQAAIAMLGRSSAVLRPPFGEWTPEVARVAAARGLPLVLWDVVSGDVDGLVPAARMVTTVTNSVRPGSIVVFHINGRGPFDKDVLPAIVAGLRARGFRFAKVSELLALPDAHSIAARPPVPARVTRRAARSSPGGSRADASAHP